MYQLSLYDKIRLVIIMRVGLALSGGGIKGAAHIGVLKALQENYIPIDIIGGTSSGSIVASLASMGYTPDEILKLFHFFAKMIFKKMAINTLYCMFRTYFLCFIKRNVF